MISESGVGSRLKPTQLLTQWRLWIYLDKIVEVKRKMLATGTLPLFLHVKIAD